MKLTTTLNDLLQTNIVKSLNPIEFMKILKMSKSTNIIVRLLTSDLTSILCDDNTLTKNDITLLIELIDNGVNFELNVIPTNLKFKEHVDFNLVNEYPQLHELSIIGYMNRDELLLDLWKEIKEDSKFVRELFLTHLFGVSTNVDCYTISDYHDCIEHIRHDYLTDEEQNLILNVTDIFDYNKLIACLLVTGELPKLILPKNQSQCVYYENSFEKILSNFDEDFVAKYYSEFPTKSIKHIKSLEMFTIILDNLDYPVQLVDYIFDYKSLQDFTVLSTDDNIIKIFDTIVTHHPHDDKLLNDFNNLIYNSNRINKFLKMYFDNVVVTRVHDKRVCTYTVSTRDELDELIKFNESHKLLEKIDEIETTDEVLSYALELKHNIIVERMIKMFLRKDLVSTHYETLKNNKHMLVDIQPEINTMVATPWECFAIHSLFGVKTQYLSHGTRNSLPKQMTNIKSYDESIKTCIRNRNDLYRFITYQFTRVNDKSNLIDLISLEIPNNNPSCFNTNIITKFIYRNERRFSQAQLEKVINIIVLDILEIGINHTKEAKNTFELILQKYQQYLTTELSFEFNILLEKHGFTNDII